MYTQIHRLTQCILTHIETEVVEKIKKIKSKKKRELKDQHDETGDNEIKKHKTDTEKHNSIKKEGKGPTEEKETSKHKSERKVNKRQKMIERELTNDGELWTKDHSCPPFMWDDSDSFLALAKSVDILNHAFGSY